jgi:TRAP-type C4-dicarboxylate transport system permease large subunit
LIKVPDEKKPGSTGPARLLMVIPLYAYMAVISGLYFLIVEQHPSGQAIFLHKFIQHPTIYVGIGLYIWAGMLFAGTRVAELCFDVLRPLGLPPPILAWLVVVIAAVPTAYSGASGIFVIAAGAVIFKQLRAEGAPRRLSLAATAMSGSLGVVLRPCLVVVLIAALNKQVTTDELFSKGMLVFALTAALFLVAMLIKNGRNWQLSPLDSAFWGCLKGLKPVVPYAAIGVAVALVYAFLFKTTINEHTAAFVLPVALLALVAYDRWSARAPEPGFVQTLKESTSESSVHVGALLMLMTSTVALGGVVERAELMCMVPESLGAPIIAMAFLVVVMVIVGMTMDPLGAVVLVSVTLAGLAYSNGIAPVHFWMMVLVAFELGYLTPPVSLNHLLARQVIGSEAHVEDFPIEGGFWARYEHLFIPISVMGTALLIVAFLPFFW